MNDRDTAPIGVFDSGVGGLTVVKSLRKRLPAESVVYLGDTARVPYGTKSPGTVVRYARNCARILLEREVKLLIVACNTASAHALDVLQEEAGIPVIGVVEPGALAAVNQTRNRRIGVIGTRGTMESGEYQRALHRLMPEAEVFVRACPLFVPLAEEGWIDGEIPVRVAGAYLEEFHEHGVDTLLLGCTHYPLLAGTIAEVMGAETRVVDSAEATAEAVAEVLEHLAARNPGQAAGLLSCFVSDAPDQFAQTGRAFLGEAIEHVEWVDF